jgi:endonuclease/exonuclease/phosphatase family metal-dependent hydrolase
MRFIGVLFLSLLSMLASNGQPTAISPQKIKLLSWNIYMLPGFVGKASMKLERAEIIGQLLSQSDYDVIVFQEAFCPQARKKIKQYLQANFPFIAGPANQKTFSLKVNSGLWIFSKHPIESSKSIVYSNRAGIDGLSRKGALLVELNVNGQLIQVAGTHLQNSGNLNLKQLQCQEFADRLLLPNLKNGVPQILCGDFNINKENDEGYKFMLSTLEASDGNLSGDIQHSYNREMNDLHVESGEKKELIDYVLIRNNNSWVSCNSREIKPIRKRWHSKHEDLSDHFSLEVEILFSNTATIAASAK